MKRYIILLVSLLCLFLFVGTCSYANSWTYSNLDSFTYNGDQLDFFKQCFEVTTGWNFDSNDYVPRNANETTYLNNCLSDLSNTRNQIIRYLIQNSSSGTHNPTGKFLYVRFVKPIGQNGYYSQYGFEYYDGQLRVTQSTGGSSSENLSGTMVSGVGLALWYCDKNNSNVSSNYTWYKSTSNTIIITSVLKYTSNKTQLINVNNNGVIGSMYKADYNLNGYINIGYLTSYKNYNQLNGYLGVFSGQSNVDNANYYDTIATFQYNKINNTQLKNNLRLDYDTGQVYINSSSISYNHAYSLYFTGDGEDTTTVALYYFVPFGSTATSGDINTDNPTGLDFDFINSIESNSGNTEYIINNEFVNSSGDLFGVVYNDRDNWGFGDFVGSTINGIYNALFNYDNVTMDFGFLGQHSSSELTTPGDNALIVIASLFCNSFLLIGAVAWFWRSILAISTLSVDKFIKDDEDLVLF